MAWGNGYNYRRTITLDHTQVGGVDQTDFPVLIAGTFAYLATVANGGKVTNASGYDIIFTSDSAGATKLNWETVFWTAASGLVEYWVKVPTVSSSTDTVIYMFYGNSAVTTDQSNKTATWDSNYKGVWHFGDGITLVLTDSTSNANNGTNNGATAGAGPSGGGALTVTRGKYADMGTGSSIEVSNPMSLETWGTFTGTFTNGQFPRIMGNISKTGSSPTDGWGFQLTANDSTPKNAPYMNAFKAGANSSHAGGSASLSASTWYHICFTYDGSNFRLYINGALQDTFASSNNIGASAFNISIADYINFSDGWVGSLDEVRISNSQRATSWILSAYNSGKASATFVTVGSEIENNPAFPWIPTYGPILAQ